MPLSKTVGIKARSLYRYLLVSFIYLHDYNLVSLFLSVTSGSFPGSRVEMSEFYPYFKEGSSVSSETQAWCSTPSVISATSEDRFPFAENTSTISTTSTAHNVSQVGQIQTFGDTTQTQTIDILDMLTQSGHYVPIPQKGTTLIPNVGFSENMLLAPTATTLVPSVGGSDTSPFQQGDVFTQQVSEVKTLAAESLHEAGKELNHLVLLSQFTVLPYLWP